MRSLRRARLLGLTTRLGASEPLASLSSFTTFPSASSRNCLWASATRRRWERLIFSVSRRASRWIMSKSSNGPPSASLAGLGEVAISFLFSSRDSRFPEAISLLLGGTTKLAKSLAKNPMLQKAYLERENKSREKGEKVEYLSLQRRMTKAKERRLFIAKTRRILRSVIIRSTKA